MKPRDRAGDIRKLHAIGVPDWIRTSGLRFRKPLLYPAELPGQLFQMLIHKFKK